MSSIAKRVRDWIAGVKRRSELERLDDVELGRIASDAGVSASELTDLSERGADSAALLPRRMRALGLDPNSVGRKEAATLRDMQRLCSMCESKGRCERDLDRDARARDWESYCPNAGTLRAL